MRFGRNLLVAAFALTFVIGSTAAAKPKGVRVRLPFNATVAGVQLPRGDYDVQWQTHSPQATVTFEESGKTVATAQGKVVDRGTRYDATQVVFTTAPDGTRRIQEIRFEGLTEVIDFD